MTRFRSSRICTKTGHSEKSGQIFDGFRDQKVEERNQRIYRENAEIEIGSLRGNRPAEGATREGREQIKGILTRGNLNMRISS